METGSYFSRRILGHVRADLQEIVDYGCTHVVHCFTETDLAYCREMMCEVIAATREAGASHVGDFDVTAGSSSP